MNLCNIVATNLLRKNRNLDLIELILFSMPYMHFDHIIITWRRKGYEIQIQTERIRSKSVNI